MRGWQDPGGDLERVPEVAQEKNTRAWWFWAGPDRVEIRVVRYVREGEGNFFTGEQLRPGEGWVAYKEYEELPPTTVLDRREALRRGLAHELHPDLHVRSPNRDACWRCGIDGRTAMVMKLAGGPIPLCPGWTEDGVWARSDHPGALSSGA